MARAFLQMAGYFSSSALDPGARGSQTFTCHDALRTDAGYVWDTPVNLSSLNTPGIDAAPNYFANPHGRPQLYFTTTRLGGPEDIHVSELQKDGAWGTPVPVYELNSPAPDGRSTIRSDGLEIIFDSSRDGGQTDLYESHRDHVWEPWSIPEKVAGEVNTSGFDARPWLSHDGRTLYFTLQTAAGHLDLLVSTRAVLREPAPRTGLRPSIVWNLRGRRRKRESPRDSSGTGCSGSRHPRSPPAGDRRV